MFGIALTACDPPAAEQPTNTVVTTITVRTAAGGPEQQARLVDPTPDPSRRQLAEAVEDTGNRCDYATAFRQLEQNGKTLDIYKLDCGSRSYQVTLVNGHSHVKPWTGILIGK